MAETNTVSYGSKPVLVTFVRGRWFLWDHSARLVPPLTYMGLPIVFADIAWAANDG